ncbi:MAG TPA: MoaD/ThiS family protein [Candidatus Thermoplasmatota archaeon]|nr:MoaD/ThiS family protein [Candidatus Thermoplasmatota archaeon]
MPTANETVTIRLPRALLQFWSGPATVSVTGTTLSEALEQVDERAPGLAGRVLDDQGRIRQHVAIFVNGAMLETREAANVPLRPGDVVRVVPSVSGG